jgi:Protein of unknown function (DUF1580)
MLELTKQLMTEGLISMSEAAKMFGSCRNGVGTHPATVTRKCLKGDRLPDGTRLKLEHVRVANRLMTSREAVIRYIAETTGACEANSAPTSPKPVASPRHSASERAVKRLKERGA